MALEKSRCKSVSANRARRRAVVLAASAMGLNALFAPVAFSDTTWTNSSGGTFANSMNWNNGVPSSSDSAWFDLNSVSGYTVTFGAAAASINLVLDNDNVNFNLGGNTYTLSGNATIGGQINSANATGDLSLSNGTLSVQAINLGEGGGSGILNQQTGAIVDATSVNVDSVADQGTGTYNISGGTLTAGSISASSTGTWIQSAGAAIATSADFSSASAFNFSGGTLTISGGTFNPLVQSIPYNYGTGTGTYNAWEISGVSSPSLRLTSGAINNPANNIAIIGNSGNSGSVIVGGPLNHSTPNAVLNLNVLLFVGLGGSNTGPTFSPGIGALNITASGQVTAPSALIGYAGGQGTLNLSGGGYASIATLYDGNFEYNTSATGIEPSTGDVTIAGDSALISSVGDIGDGTATGTVTLGISGATADGSSWDNSGAITISSTGYVTVYGGTTINTNSLQVSNGWLTLSGGTIVTSTLALSGGAHCLTWNSGNIEITGSITDSPSLTVPSAGKLIFESNNSAITTLSGLTINAGGIVNLNNNHIFINYTGGPDPKATILGYLSNGANGGGWNGTGIVSSTANANPNYGVGLADGADGLDPNLTSGQIEIGYVQYGDITMQGLVNAADFHILASNFGQVTTLGWEAGDFLYAGTVNAQDFHLLAENFGQTASGESVAVSASDWAAIDAFEVANGLAPTSVPEPMALGLVMLAGSGLFARRRRA